MGGEWVMSKRVSGEVKIFGVWEIFSFSSSSFDILYQVDDEIIGCFHI